MTIHGDLYYEGKEFETRLREKKPGDLSEELRTALGMPVGPGSHKVRIMIHTSWLVNEPILGVGSVNVKDYRLNTHAVKILLVNGQENKVLSTAPIGTVDRRYTLLSFPEFVAQIIATG